ncbi:hypothetical protein CQA66_04960 [Helicobacter aurati]|uniref:Sialidase domain-containing protein n=1 Tax=Helicobacter aurati TaxID=137778 RepID=A0A3D8J685_9HELI|nr:hypothetical protein [Helicobacter aurati]RDU72414.1 hypothetical protein CQA66_04960 [Helicobacter aurati]
MQRYIDILFYIVLCLVAGIGIFLHSSYTDKYFPLATNALEQEPIYEVYQQDLRDKLHNIYALSAETIGNHTYLITFFDTPLMQSSLTGHNLYGLLFSPSEYSLATHNSQVWSDAKILATQDFLLQQTKQYINGISRPIIYQNNNQLFLFLNTQGKFAALSNKIRVFSTSINDLHDVFRSDAKTNIPFKFIKNISFSGFGNFNHFLSDTLLPIYDTMSPVHASQDSLDSQTRSAFILSFILQLKTHVPIFALLDSNLKLQEKLVIDTSLEQPTITQLPVRKELFSLDKQTKTYSCIAAYIHNSKRLYFQTCELHNGTLQMDSLQESLNIDNVTSIELATIGEFVLLLYTQNNTTLNLALWNGTDFSPIQQIAYSNKQPIVSKLLADGDKGYIFYVNEKAILQAIMFNESYLTQFTSQEDKD